MKTDDKTALLLGRMFCMFTDLAVNQALKRAANFVRSLETDDEKHAPEFQLFMAMVADEIEKGSFSKVLGKEQP